MKENIEKEEGFSVGSQIRAQRKSMNLSLDEAAERTGVSKTMMGQIERGEANPSLSTLWKIATGLKLTMSSLLSMPGDSGYSVNRLEDLKCVEDDNGRVHVYTVFPFNPLVPIDFLYAIQEPGNIYPSVTHKSAKEEYVFVIKGELTLHVGDGVYVLHAGDSMSFRGSEDHTYENAGSERLEFHSIVIY